jgi:membrane-associated phospholipid phosphatase
MTPDPHCDPWRDQGHRLLLIDKIIIAYASIVVVVALTRLDVSSGNWGVALGHFLMLPLAWLVRRPGLGKTGRILGDIYPIFLLMPLYGALDVLQGPHSLPVNDSIVLGWEQAIFGELKSEVWWQRYPYPWLSTIMHGAYWGYYLIVPTPILYFAFRGERHAARRAILLEMGTFLFCYLWFLFFPVAGPYHIFPWPTGPVVDNPMAKLVYATLSSGNSYGAAFPSSHVAATTSAVLGAWLGSRWLGSVLVVPAILLAFGTVYCHMHYAIDASLGLVTGIVIPLLLLKWDSGRCSRMEG